MRLERVTVSVVDSTRFFDLVERLWPLLGASCPLPEPAPFVAPFSSSWDVPWGTLQLSRRRLTADPYAGGPIDQQCLRLDGADRRFLVCLQEVIWVGMQLDLLASGPDPWLASVTAAVQDFARDVRRVPAAT